MHWDSLKPRRVDGCRFRYDVEQENGIETATCQLVKTILGTDNCRARVRREACAACCNSFPPSADAPNPVVASLVYNAATQVVESGDATDAERATISERRESMTRHMDCLHDGDPPASPTAPPGRNGLSLSQLVPPPKTRHGPTPKRWAVGVTTAPRRQPTLERFLDGLITAGWDRPHLFIDSAVTVPDRLTHLPMTFRTQKLGAWPNYYLALAELLMEQPHADAYLMLQDDALLADRPGLPGYLETVLWPGTEPGIVSLYCSQADSRWRPGWFRKRGRWRWGALAFVFPRPLAKSFVADPMIVEHRWHPEGLGTAGIDALIGGWVVRRGLSLWYPTPSLVQHIGDTSAIWSTAENSGPRRADRFSGDT